jgi:hypothetical protein
MINFYTNKTVEEIKSDEELSKNEITEEALKEDDEFYDTSTSNEGGFFSEIPTCTKVGLGIFCAGTIGLVLCKLFSNSDSKD